MVIRKKIIEEVRPFIGTDVVKVITGVRRCGKSVLMSQIRDLIVSEIDKGAPVFYLDLDDESNAKYLKAGGVVRGIDIDSGKPSESQDIHLS